MSDSANTEESAASRISGVHKNEGQIKLERRQVTMSACRITFSVDDATNDDVIFAVDCDVKAEEECAASAGVTGGHTRLSPFDAERIVRRVTDKGQRVMSRPRCSSMPTLRALEVDEARGALVDLVVPNRLRHDGQGQSVDEAAAAALRQRRSISTDRLYLEPIEEEHGSQVHQHRFRQQQQTCLLAVACKQIRRYSAPNSAPADAD